MTSDADAGHPSGHRNRRRAALAVAGCGLLLVAAVLLWWRPWTASAQCPTDDPHVNDVHAGLCYPLPEGWAERPPGEATVTLTSMASSEGGDDSLATVMVGRWSEMFDRPTPEGGAEPAASWLASESGVLAPPGEGDLDAEDRSVGEYPATTVTTRMGDGEDAVHIRVTAVEVDGDIAVVLGLAPATDGQLVGALDEIHDSLAPAG